MQYVHSTHLIVIGIVQYIISKVINESSIKINFWEVIITMNEMLSTCHSTGISSIEIHLEIKLNVTDN